MAEVFKVAAVQSRADADPDRSLDECERLAREARDRGAALVCLPEFCACLSLDGRVMSVGAEPEDGHRALARLSRLAADLGTWLLAGSVGVRMPSGKIRNRSCLFDPSGAEIARYDKVHLFDVDLADGESYRESDTVEPGDEAVVAPTPWGGLGMTVCYDLRFAYLYRALAQAGAAFLAVPSAFTARTGPPHWEVLLRARAIETGCFVIAPGQYGRHGDAETHGHSLVVSPWGEVLDDAGDGPGLALAEVDPARVDDARRRIPALRHDRPLRAPAQAAGKL